ncbi:MAG: FliG C-terminal domain-containing protein [Vulcanimicrobiota bacterium]
MFDIPNTEEEVARPRHTMKKKGEEEEEGRPVLSRVASQTSRPSRKDRLFAALRSLDETRLARVLSEVDPEEAALALLEADQPLIERVASGLSQERAGLFRQYLAMGDAKVSAALIDSAQGKLLRLSN